jgi:hypothetical protein
LTALDWAQVFDHPPQGIAFARSLFEDVADMLDVPNPFPGVSHPLTTRRLTGTLRNIQ